MFNNMALNMQVVADSNADILITQAQTEIWRGRVKKFTSKEELMPIARKHHIDTSLWSEKDWQKIINKINEEA